jgi:hypothetical protein
MKDAAESNVIPSINDPESRKLQAAIAKDNKEVAATNALRAKSEVESSNGQDKAKNDDPVTYPGDLEHIENDKLVKVAYDMGYLTKEKYKWYVHIRVELLSKGLKGKKLEFLLLSLVPPEAWHEAGHKRGWDKDEFQAYTYMHICTKTGKVLDLGGYVDALKNMTGGKTVADY